MPDFWRSPRSYPAVPTDEVAIQPPAPLSDAPAFSPLSLLLPLAGIGLSLGLSLWLFPARGSWLLITLPMLTISLAAGVLTHLAAKKAHAQRSREREESYERYLFQVSGRLEALSTAQRQQAEYTHRAPETLQLDARLWECTPGDPDFLELRLGSGLAAPTFRVILPPTDRYGGVSPDPLLSQALDLARRYQRVASVVTVAAGEHSLALVGPDAAEIGRALLVNLAARHAPGEVILALFLTETTLNDWKWARWLPHIWDESHSRRYLAHTDTACAALAEELALRARREGALGRIVVVIADPALLALTALLPLIQLAGERRLSLIALAARPEQAPAVCRSLLLSEGWGGARLRQIGPPTRETAVQPDRMDGIQAERFARLLAPLRLAGGDRGGRTLVRLSDILELSAESIRAHWQDSQPFRTLSAPLGLTSAGKPLVLDLHERGHGPHGLVAGATGSGKSDLLQTLAVSLAAHYRPDELAILVMDFKGGGMAGPLRNLPHLAGVITNLDETLARRALLALRAELTERQARFESLGVSHIDEYQRRRRADDSFPALPRLVVIVDEFAELSQALPDFLPELVSTARLGRSLGVHLILATQKPAGVVSEQIWSNARLRLCLRVEQPTDSREVLKLPDAAYLTRPGQVYFQVGAGEIFERFQAAWGGAPYQPQQERCIARLELDGRRVRLWPEQVESAGRMEMDALVEMISQVAQDVRLAGPVGLWTPPLPQHIPLENLPQPGEVLQAIAGLVDLPARRQQGALVLSLAHGNLLVLGAPRTGKTSLLQTLVASLCQASRSSELHIYVVDSSGWAFKPFEALPQVGAVASLDDLDRLSRLFAHLQALLARRKQSQPSHPATLLVLDNYTTFATEAPELVANLEALAREGPGAGLYIALSSADYSSLPRRISGSFAQCLALEMTDPGEYPVAIGGRWSPKRNLPGRGVLRAGQPLEFQAAFPDLTWLTALPGPAAPPVPARPQAVYLDELPAGSGTQVPVGLDALTLEPVYLDLASAPTALVCAALADTRQTMVDILAQALITQRPDLHLIRIVTSEDLDGLTPLQTDGSVLLVSNYDLLSLPAREQLSDLLSGVRLCLVGGSPTAFGAVLDSLAARWREHCSALLLDESAAGLYRLRPEQKGCGILVEGGRARGVQYARRRPDGAHTSSKKEGIHV